MVPFCINADTGRRERTYLIIDNKKEALSNPKDFYLWSEAIWKDGRQSWHGGAMIHKSRK